MDNTEECTSLPKSQQIKKPLFITLQKTGNNFTFAKPSNISKIPKLCVPMSDLSTLRLVNTNGTGYQGNVKKKINGNHLLSIHTSQNVNKNEEHSSQSDTTIYQRKYQTQNQLTTVSTYPLMNEIGITTKQTSSKPLNCSRKSAVAPASIAISKGNLVKRTYKRKQPNKPSTKTQFNFPPPPPKMDFKVTTTTQFMTTIDNTPKEALQTPVASANSSTLEGRDGFTSSSENNRRNPPLLNENGAGGSNGVPTNCTLLRKLKIDTANSHARSDSKVQDSSKITHRFSSEQLKDAIESIEWNDSANPSRTISVLESDPKSVYGSTAESVSKSTDEPVMESVARQSEYCEILHILRRMEALHLASANRESQILVAVKKLCLAYTKHNNDNDEIKKLLPMKTLLEFGAMDTRLIEDPVFLEKFRAFLRGFKTATSPENFSSLLSVLMSDELVDKFNLRGILGKQRLKGCKIIEIIQDMHKPMDAKIFEKCMCTTIELAKNRYHNEIYRLSHQKNVQQNGMN